MTDTFDYAKTAETSARLLAKFGANVTLRNYGLGVYNPATGLTDAAFSDTTRKGALFDFAQGQTNGPGGLIQIGDKKLLLEPSYVVQLEDHVIVPAVNGNEYVIKGIGEVNPAGTSVLYTLHLRRG